MGVMAAMDQGKSTCTRKILEETNRVGGRVRSTVPCSAQTVDGSNMRITSHLKKMPRGMKTFWWMYKDVQEHRLVTMCAFLDNLISATNLSELLCRRRIYLYRNHGECKILWGTSGTCLRLCSGRSGWRGSQPRRCSSGRKEVTARRK